MPHEDLLSAMMGPGAALTGRAPAAASGGQAIDPATLQKARAIAHAVLDGVLDFAIQNLTPHLAMGMGMLQQMAQPAAPAAGAAAAGSAAEQGASLGARLAGAGMAAGPAMGAMPLGGQAKVSRGEPGRVAAQPAGAGVYGAATGAPGAPPPAAPTAAPPLPAPRYYFLPGQADLHVAPGMAAGDPVLAPDPTAPGAPPIRTKPG